MVKLIITRSNWWYELWLSCSLSTITAMFVLIKTCTYFVLPFSSLLFFLLFKKIFIVIIFFLKDNWRITKQQYFIFLIQLNNVPTGLFMSIITTSDKDYEIITKMGAIISSKRREEKMDFISCPIFFLTWHNGRCTVGLWGIQIIKISTWQFGYKL